MVVIGDCEQLTNANAVRAVVVAVMGCFFGCFKIKEPNLPFDSQSHPVPLSLPTEEPLVSRKRSPLSSLFTEDNDETNTNQSSDTTTPQLDTNDLRNQAKFLKAWGTLPETPVEIRNGLVKYKDLSAQREEIEPLKFNSCPSEASFQKLPDEPTRVGKDGIEKQFGSVEHTPSSCCTDGPSCQRFCSINGGRNSNTPITFEFNANLDDNNNSELVASPITSTTAQSVCFKSEPELSGNYNLTALKLSEEMQTPGTVFPAYLDHTEVAKTGRIRSQYANRVLNPMDNATQLKESSEEDSYSTQDSNSRLFSSLITNSDQRSDEANQVQSKYHFHSVDRPIIGLVATHWNDDETSRVPPKWWDGNGIPNSTHKYKEDQKVSWHATPFEERLEKAILGETMISQRKQFGMPPPIVLIKTEESDTAISQKH